MTMWRIVGAAALLAAAGSVSADGQSTYATKCLACHLAGAAGAPKLDDAAAWEARIARGVESMVATVKSGKGAMPPMGTCVGCSDAELTAAVEYMISQVK